MHILKAISTAGAALLLLLQGSEAKSPLDYEREFAAWMKTHHLTFGDALEYARRLENYIVNDRIITKHNSAATHSYTLGHNQFSHLSSEEFKQRMRGLAISQTYLQQRLAHKPSGRNWTNVATPKSVDWVAKGGVTPIKNQGQCGSCWAFSTTGAVEGAAFVASGQLVSLSEQELVDCDDNGDMGCNGGLMDHAFEWIETHRGICAEDDYAYVAKKGICRKCRRVVEVTGFQDVDPNDEHALEVAVAQQPVAVAIEADQVEFQLYKSGVFDSECGTQLDHGVLVVGYGEENGQKYWKVKNSWGPTWGQKGYILLSRGASGPQGQCGIAMAPSYPFATVVKQNNSTISTTTTTTTTTETTAAALATPLRSSAKISQCGDKQKSIIGFDELEIHPTAPKRGKPIVFFGKGDVRRAFATASFSLVVRLGGEHVFGHDGLLCGDTHVPLPLGLGHIDVHGFACPMAEGKFSDLKVDVNLPVIAPAGNYNIELHATTDGQEGEDALFCVNVELDLTMNGASSEQQVRVYEPLAEM